MKKTEGMFSSAFNSLGHLSGSADPKTGTFSFRQLFCLLQADAGLGPGLKLSTSFSPLGTMSGNQSGVGSGWSFNLASYSHKILMLNSGASYKVLDSFSTPWELSHKLQDFHVKRTGSNIHICHKNGDVEILAVDPDYGNGYITSYISASGRYLKFEYFQKSGYQRLTKVSDSTSTLAKVAYNDNSYVTTITAYPGTSEEKLYTLNFHSNGLLYNMQLPQKQQIHLEYKVSPFPDHQATMYLINKVQYPNGVTENVEYEKKLFLPTGAPVPYLPAVSSHTKHLADSQPPVTTTFSYGDDPSDENPANNFWGYNAGITWQDNNDQLYDYPGEYTYTSQTVCGTAVSQYTYNKFHQALVKVETNGSTSHKKITTLTHYSIEDAPLSKQPSTYELVKGHSVKYVTPDCSSKDFSMSYVYDDFGNITSKVDVSGVTTKSTYFPCSGGDGCPPHPHGLVAFLKQKTTLANDGSDSKTHSYTYKSLPPVKNPYYTTTCVVPLLNKYKGSFNSYTYFDRSDPKVQCAVKSHTMTIGGKITTKSFAFSFTDSKACVTSTVTGYDGATTSSSKTHSIWSGLSLQHVDSLGVVTDYTYDITGRITAQKTTGSSGITLTATFSCTDNPPSTSQNGATQIGTLVVKTTNAGVSEHTYYNGNHHELSVFHKDQYGILRKVSENQYDNQGRVQSKAIYDFEISDTDHSVLKRHLQSSSYLYGYWGEVKETKNGKGVIELDSVDHVSMQTTKQLVRRDDPSDPEKVTSSLAQTVTTHDTFGNPTRIEQFDKSGATYSTSSFAYDGFGRKVSATTPTGTTTYITRYDDYDRPVDLKKGDGSITNVSYVDFSPKALVSSVHVPTCDFTVGHQEYDSLLRVTSKTVNGVQTTFSYEEGQKKPFRKLNARGQTVLFEYIPELGDQPKRIGFFSKDVQKWDDKSKVSENVYTYAANNPSHTGQILAASGPNGRYNYEYTSNGMIQKVTQVVGSLSKEITNDKISLLGKPLSISIGTNRSITVEYNEHGEPISSTDSNLKSETAYDDFGHVVRKSAKQFTGKGYELLQSTEISYDEFGRETMRTIATMKTKQVLCIKSVYDVAHKLVRRETTLNKKDSLTEIFKYDNISRLEAYDASKYTSEALLPCNENGRAFVSQKFAFDVLDNITTIITTFPNNGGCNIASFLYDQENKQRLKLIKNDLTKGVNSYPPCITMTYDADGNMLSMNDTKMTYTVSGHMSSKNDNKYSYDPYERLVKTNETARFYSGAYVVQELDVVNTTEFIQDAHVPLAEVQNGKKILYGLDNKSSVVFTTDNNASKYTTYAPYGSGDNGARIGLNGQLKDVAGDGTYPLGNGTRSFWPAIAGFSAADSFSPFQGGGINPYRYCGGDPVNTVDPSGHKPVQLWKWLLDGASLVVAVVAVLATPFTAGSSLGLGIAFASFAMGVASSCFSLASDALEQENQPKTSKMFSYISLALGIGSALLSVGQPIADAAELRNIRSLAENALSESIDASDTTSVEHLISSKFKFRFTIASDTSSNEPTEETLTDVSEVRENGGARTHFGSDTREVDLNYETNKCGIFFRRTKVPYKMEEFMRHGELRSLRNIISKSTVLSTNANGTLRFSSVLFVIISNSAAIYESSKGYEGIPMYPILHNAISSYGIPANHHLKW